ncbi:hypothetical protein CsSME_00021045 [Camellia sinensis var. sinensis]
MTVHPLPTWIETLKHQSKTFPAFIRRRNEHLLTMLPRRHDHLHHLSILLKPQPSCHTSASARPKNKPHSFDASADADTNTDACRNRATNHHISAPYRTISLRLPCPRSTTDTLRRSLSSAPISCISYDRGPKNSSRRRGPRSNTNKGLPSLPLPLTLMASINASFTRLFLSPSSTKP